MKFAIVCPYDLSIPGGVQEISLEMHTRLPKFGHESTLISTIPQRKVSIPNTRFFGKSIQFPVNRSWGTISEGDFLGTGEIESFLTRENFDITCIHEPAIPFLNWEILKFPNSTKIGWFHSSTPDPNKVHYKLFDYFYGHKLKDLNSVIYISSLAKKTWGRYSHRKGPIIPPGIDIKKFEGAKKIRLSPYIKILFVGRLEARKGLLHALKAVKLILKSKQVKFYIVGDGPEREVAEKFVENLGHQNNIIFLGKIAREKLPSYFRSSDIFVAPSLGGESFGIVLLEAMAAGIPIVAYANPGYRSTLEGYPYKEGLVKVGAYKKLAQSVNKLLEDKKLVEEISGWEKEEVKKFDWDKIIKKFLDYAIAVQTKS